MSGDDLRLLFRFRDLVGDTITEHRRVIDAHGSAWWGWWKRPSEDLRADVWERLKKDASAQNPVRVGLFDSGHGDVYTATVVDVIPPGREGERVPVPDAQKELVPAYYREGSFSRAWMRLTSISDRVELFGRYSFAEPPKLPGYRPEALARFAGKVIRSADELRPMDTTIFVVRLRDEKDRDEAILVTTPGLTGPISFEPVSCDSTYVLHLTDPHFAIEPKRDQHVWRLETEDQRRPSLVEAITAALAKRGVSRLAFIVVTGDLTFRGAPEEFEAARTALVRLLGNFNLRPDQLIVVPGNHDIVWTSDETYSDTSEVTEAPAKARQNYQDFYSKLFGHAAGRYLSMGRRYALPSGVIVEVCALNSTSLEQGKNFLAGMGRVEQPAFSETATKLGWGSDSSLALRILALHHHLALTEDLEPASGFAHGFGLAVDAPRILRMAAGYGAQLAIHGHKHRAFIWRSSVYELPEYTQPTYRLGDVSIVGGGSAGSADTESKSNFFNLLTIGSDGLELELFRSPFGSGIFQPMQSYRAPYRLDSATKRLELTDWQVKS